MANGVAAFLLGGAVVVGGLWAFGAANGKPDGPPPPPPPRECTSDEQSDLSAKMLTRMRDDMSQAIYFRNNESTAVQACSFDTTQNTYKISVQYSFDGQLLGDHFSATAESASGQERVGFSAFQYSDVSQNLIDAFHQKNITLKIAQSAIESSMKNNNNS
jgi:hypothetical protein